MENSNAITASMPEELSQVAQSDIESGPSEKDKNKAIIEALLFASGEPLTVGAVAKATSLTEQGIRELFRELMNDYRERGSGIVIAEIADGFEMATAPELAAWIRKMKNINVSNKLSQPSIETLSIIAYKQPITKVEVDQLRGVNSDAAVKSLLDKRLIKIVGKKESPGRPFLYATTNEFLQYFGLKNLTELPAIHDFFNTEAA
ncbi:MAG TPA: SMC-Scp complex subunit ScpB [Dissulfurispiraceae bacterium]|nr:SMC-Scp complex subunit ScpB [Dissulfurispiraceae bacterium]